MCSDFKPCSFRCFKSFHSLKVIIMALRLIVLVCLSLSSVQCYSLQVRTVKPTILFEMRDDIMLSKCRKTAMGALLDENLVEFLQKCDVPRPEGSVVRTADDAEGFLCLGYYDVSLNLCKYFSVDKNTHIDLPMNIDDIKNVSKLLDSLTDFCTKGHLAVGPSEFEQTKYAIEPLLTLLSDHSKCRRACYGYDDTLNPICKFLLWTNRKLSEYEEVRKEAEKIMALKKTITSLPQPKDVPEAHGESLPPITPPQVVDKNIIAIPVPAKPSAVVKPAEPIAPSSPKKSAVVTKPDTHVYNQASANNASELPNAVGVSSVAAVDTTKTGNVEPAVSVTIKPVHVAPPLQLDTVEKSTPIQTQPKLPTDPNRISQQQQTSEEQITGPIFKGMPNSFSETNGNPDPDMNGDEFGLNGLQASNGKDPEANYEGGDDVDQMADIAPEIPSSSSAAKGRPNGATSGALVLLFSSWLFFYYK